MAKPLHFIKENAEQTLCSRSIFKNDMYATYFDAHLVTCLNCLKQLLPNEGLYELIEIRNERLKIK